MAAQTFTVRNTGSSSTSILQILFNTPAGIRHVADLSNFGGPSNFIDNVFNGSTDLLLAANQTITFSVDHVYLGGSQGTRSGSILIIPLFGDSVTIATVINVLPIGASI